MQFPKIENKNLAFIDIEATDKSDEKRIIQLSGYRVDLDGSVKELNLRFNPQQKLSTQIINLLKLDDDILSANPTFESKLPEIKSFLDDTVIISFGSLDKTFLTEEFKRINEELSNEWFDFQNELKKYSGTEVSLLNLYTLAINKPDPACQHDALYDASMLKELFYTFCNLDESQVENYCKLANLIPRKLHPKHEIFSTNDLAKPIENYPKESENPIIIKTLQVSSFTKKTRNSKEKKSIHYIKHLEYIIPSPNEDNPKTFVYNCNMSFQESSFEDIYIPNISGFLKNMLKHCKYRAFFFDNISRSDINALLETIYDCLKEYVCLKYITLNYIRKLNKHAPDSFKYFNEYLSSMPLEIQNKFIGFRTWKRFK